MEKNINYAIITNGDHMKDIICFDIQTLIRNDENIDNIIDVIKKTMEKHYPSFCTWFDDKLIPGLSNGTRNIIVMFKNNKLIGFVNLKKTNKEKKMSNLHINSFFYYDKYWNILVDNSIEWLEEEDPVIIISKKELSKCNELVVKRGWYITDKSKNDDYILNRHHEIEYIKKRLKKKKR